MIHAAAISYGFVFLHPFGDGNGRIHRFLIHNILARQGLIPAGLLIPVSAAMLSQQLKYDESLEAFSKPLMEVVKHSLDGEGQITIHNDTMRWYRFMDLTFQTEALFDFIQSAVDTQLVEELELLANYDAAKHAVQKIVDMPHPKVDLIIRLCLKNNWRLSKSKREKLFEFLSEDEVSQMEAAIKFEYGRT